MSGDLKIDEIEKLNTNINLVDELFGAPPEIESIRDGLNRGIENLGSGATLDQKCAVVDKWKAQLEFLLPIIFENFCKRINEEIPDILVGKDLDRMILAIRDYMQAKDFQFAAAVRDTIQANSTFTPIKFSNKKQSKVGENNSIDLIKEFVKAASITHVGNEKVSALYSDFKLAVAKHKNNNGSVEELNDLITDYSAKLTVLIKSEPKASAKRGLTWDDQVDGEVKVEEVEAGLRFAGVLEYAEHLQSIATLLKFPDSTGAEQADVVQEEKLSKLSVILATFDKEYIQRCDAAYLPLQKNPDEDYNNYMAVVAKGFKELLFSAATLAPLLDVGLDAKILDNLDDEKYSAALDLIAKKIETVKTIMKNNMRLYICDNLSRQPDFKEWFEDFKARLEVALKSAGLSMADLKMLQAPKIESGQGRGVLKKQPLLFLGEEQEPTSGAAPKSQSRHRRNNSSMTFNFNPDSLPPPSTPQNNLKM